MSSAKVCGVLLPTGSQANVCRKTNVRGEVCGICEKCAACACVCVMSSVECVGHFYQLVPKPVQVIKRLMLQCLSASVPEFVFLLLNTGRAVSFITWTTIAGK